MSLDAQLILADNQAQSGTGNTTITSNIVKLSQVDNPNPGNAARPNRMKLIVNTAYTVTATGLTHDITFTLWNCNTSGGTYVETAFSLIINNAILEAKVSGDELYDGPIPGGLQQFCKLLTTKTVSIVDGNLSAFFY